MSGRWAALVGDRASGREGACERLCEALDARGVALGGVRQEAAFEGDEHIGYDLIDLTSGTRLPLARESRTPRLCRWAFDADAFGEARRWAREGASDVVAFDVASLEASGEGHWQAIEEAFASDRLVLLSLRPRVLAQVALKLPDPTCGLELPADDASIDAFAVELAEAVRG